MQINELTGPERVLYVAQYNFAINVLKMTENEAQAAAIQKIEKKRKLAKRVPRY